MPARFAQVDEHLFRGGAPSEKDLGALKHIWGVNKIVSLDSEVGEQIHPYCNKLELEHIIIPLHGGDDPNADVLPNEIKTWSSTGPVYVHCYHGKDRTGMTCALYRILIDGWTINDALVEAYSFGMGKGLSRKLRQSYFDGVKRLARESEDNQKADTIVDEQRDYIAKEQFAPAVSNQSNSMPYQESFAPFLDAETNHLSITSLERLCQKRLIKKCNAKMFKFSPQSHILRMKQLWYGSMSEARMHLDGDPDKANMFAANISGDAKVIEYEDDFSDILAQAAMLKEADIVIFKPINSAPIYLVVNPQMILDIHQIGQKDQNDALDIGLHDNYTGVAPDSFPGTQGFMGGAGAVELPFGSQF